MEPRSPASAGGREPNFSRLLVMKFLLLEDRRNSTSPWGKTNQQVALTSALKTSPVFVLV
jgi:hypothetical protein